MRQGAALSVGRYAYAFLTVGIASLVLWLAPAVLADRALGYVFLVAVFASTVLGGPGPGYTAMLLSLIVANAFFMTPRWQPFAADNVAGQVAFIALGTLLVWMVGRRRRAEQERRISEQRFRTAQELSLDGFTILRAVRDRTGTIVDFEWVYANPAAERILRHEELAGKRLLEVLPGNRENKDLFTRYAAITESGEGHAAELFYDADGIRGWFRNVAVKLEDGVAVSFSDISERKAAEADLHEAWTRAEEGRRTLLTLLENVPEGIVITGGPPDFPIQWVSRRGLELTGRSITELTDLPAGFHQAAWHLLLPDGLTRPPTEQMPLYRAAHLGEEMRDMELLLRTAEGREIPLLVNAAPIRDAEGRVTGAINCWRDITERKRAEEALLDSERQLRALAQSLEERVKARTAELESSYEALRRSEEALRESERLYRAIGESIPYGVWVCNSTGEMEYLSDSFLNMIGMTLDECKHYGWMSRLLPEEVEPTIAAWERCAADPHFWEWEHHIRATDGRYRSVLSRGVPIRDGEERVLLWAGVNLDITDIKRMESALRQSERLAAIGQMMTGLSHESRNALQRSLACVEMLEKRVRDHPHIHRLVYEVRQANDDLLRVYESVQDYARPIHLDRSLTDVAEVWRRAWEKLMARQGRNALLVEDCASGELRCELDAQQMEQVFRNILENALAAAPDPVEIRLSCHPVTSGEGSMLRIAVRDNGPGLSSELQAQAFDPFFTTKTRGTGLGLPIVRRIVEAHGGHVNLGSQTEQGLEVVIEIPRITH